MAISVGDTLGRGLGTSAGDVGTLAGGTSRGEEFETSAVDVGTSSGDTATSD